MFLLHSLFVLSLLATHGHAVGFSGITSSADGHFLAATYPSGNIWTSTNTGFTWTEEEATNNWVGITSSANGTKLAAIAENIWTSSDFGATWKEHSVGGGSRGWSSITSSADGHKLAAVGTGIWTSKDEGMTWAQETVGTGGTKSWYRITSSNNGNVLIAAGGTGGTGSSQAGIWKSEDAGTTWTKFKLSWTPSFPPYYTIAPIASSTNGTKLAALSGNSVWTSQDSTTWKNHTLKSPLSAAVGLSYITSSADGTQLAVLGSAYTAATGKATGSYIWTSTNSGVNWTAGLVLGPPPNVEGYTGMTSSADGMELAISGSDIIWISHDGGITWSLRTVV